MNPLSETLAGRPLLDAATVPVSATVGEALARAAGHWLIAVDSSHGPVAAAAPGALDRQPADRPLATVLHDLPPAVIAAADTPLRAFLGSWVIEELEPRSGVVVVTRGTVRGVWAGPDLARIVAIASGARATFGDERLPGDITIPLLTKGCGFEESGTPCTAVRQFPERPDPMPPCDNPAGLSPHPFRW